MHGSLQESNGKKVKKGLLVLFAIGFFSISSVQTLFAFQFSENTTITDELAQVRRSTSAWGDYDSDGDLDLAVSGYTSTGVIRLYKNDGAGGFTIDTNPFPIMISVHIGTLSWGDYDNDGDLDLVVTGRKNSGSAPSSNMYENKNGIFELNTSISSSLTDVEYSAAAWGDYDNDGDLDLVISGTTGSGNTGANTILYNNDGNGGFSNSGINLPDVWEGELAWGDYNNDGFLDLAISGQSSSGRISQIFKNDGIGNLANSGVSLDGVHKSSLEWGDYDNDGDLDLVLSGFTDASAQITKVYRNDGLDVFNNSGISLIGLRLNSVRWNDYNNDGHLDLLVTGSTTDNGGGSGATTKMYENDGSGGLSEDLTLSLPDIGYSSVAFGDYDNDGDSDLFMSGFDKTNNNFSKIYENISASIPGVPSAPQNLSSSFNTAQDTLTLSWDYVDNNFDSAYSYNVFITDTDNSDSSTDSLGAPMADLTTGFRLVAEAGNAGIDNEYKIAINNVPIGEEYSWGVQTINSNSKASAFTTSTFIKPGLKEDVALTGAYWSSSDWGDYDNDGDLDFVVAGLESPGINTRLYTNNGDGTFSINSSATSTFRGLLHSAVAWGDYNNDGYLDLVITGGEDGSSYFSELYTNNGDGIFALDASATSLFEGVLYGDVVWGDIDNDLDLDLVISGKTNSGNSTKVYENNGGSFTLKQSLTAVELSSLSFADYDNDGDLDLMLTGTTNGSNSGKYGELYQNTNGTFTEINVSLDSNRKVTNGDTDWGDYDNDGDLDLVITGLVGSSKETNLYQNTNGTFSLVTAVSDTLIDVENSSVAFGDYDGDGDLDLIVSGLSSSGRVTRLYDYNNGSFTTNNDHAIEASAVGSLIWVDYNNDGKLDLSQTGFGATAAITKLYKNTITTTSGTSSAPGVPQNLSASFNASSDSLLLSWDESTDAEGGPISYNLYVFSTENADTLINGLADTTSGFRRIITPGNAGYLTSKKIKLPDDINFFDNYRFLVQAIDGSHLTSTFAGTTFGFKGLLENTAISSVLAQVRYSSLAWGDYDNDGDLDLIISGYTGSNWITKVYENDGRTFTDINAGLPGLSFGSLPWGDYDNDGDLDLVLSGGKVYENDQGVFSDINAGITSISSVPVSWGDYDNDGDLDLVVSVNESGYKIKVYENDKGVFTGIETGITGVTSGSLALGDYDNDGDLDLVISGTTNGGSTGLITKVYENDGGAFTDIEAGLTGVYESSLAWGDYDNDGDLDLVVSGNSSSGKITKIYENDGEAFIEINAGLTGVFVGSVVWGDFDNDGDLDLVISGATDEGLLTGTAPFNVNEPIDGITKVYENNGGVFTDIEAGLTGVVHSALLWGDYDNDGDLDLVISGTDLELSVENGNHTGITKAYENFPESKGTAPSRPTGPIITSLDVSTEILTISWGAATDAEGGPLSYNVLIADRNNANADTLGAPMVNGITGYRRIPAMGNAGLNTEYEIDMNAIPIGSYEIGVQAIDGSFKSSAFRSKTYIKSALIENTDVTFTESVYGSLAWGDYDNDGDLDLVVSGQSSSGRITKIYANDEGTFTDIEAGLTGVRFGSVAWGDYDNDNDLDLVISGSDGSNFGFEDYVTKLYVNNEGGFKDSNVQLTGVVNSSLAWADYDNDGDLDLVVSGQSSSGRIAKIYANDEGAFTDIETGLTGVFIGSVTWGDYDNDGDLDLVVSGNTGSGQITKVYANDGGIFRDIEAGIIGVQNSSLAWGDYDNDGDLDLVVSGASNGLSTGAITKLYKNDGNGGFTDINAGLTGVEYSSLSWGDYDNDGDLDLVVSGQSSSGRIAKIYANDEVAFTDIEAGLTGVSSGSVAWGDYDNDRDLDLVVSGTIDGGVPGSNTILYENFPTSKGSAPSPPSNLTAQINASRDTLTLSWDAPNDTDGGSLSYNVFLINTDVVDTVSSAMADHSTGFRRIPLEGNAGLSTEYKIGLLSHPVGTYEWGVQAIDGSFKSSPFATSNDPELIFSPTVFTITENGFILYKDESNALPDDLFSITDFYSDSTVYISTTSPASGSIFLDVNNDSTKGEGERFLTESGIQYPFPEGAKLRINKPTAYGLDTINVYLRGTVNENVEPDSVRFSFSIFEATPTISGNENENGWYLLANPFTTTVGELMDNVWTQGAINSDAPTGSPTLYTFSVESAAYVPITTDLDTTTIDAGEGLLAYIFEDDTPADNAEVNGGWPKTLTNYGNPFGVQVSVPIKNMDVNSSGGTSGSEGFKLFGNPFGWDLSVDSLITALVEIDPLTNRYVYRWNPISKEYELELSGGIKPYESVFIRTITSGLDATIALEYDDIYEVIPIKVVPLEPFELILTNSSHNIHSTSVLQFTEEEAAVGIDPFDGYYLGSYASRYANLYTQVDDQSLKINNLPDTLNEILEFPIYLDATVSGDFDLNWNKELLPEGWTFTLEEVATSTVIDLKKQDQFSFIHSVQAKVKETGEQENTYQTDKVSDEEGDKVLRLAKNKTGLDVEASKITEEEDSTPTNMSGIHAVLKSKIKSSGTEPVFILTINPLTSTGNESDLGLPTVVELDQNYPNPFNPSSVIRFGVPTQAKVTLEVFDILGRRVATLLNDDIKQPGRYNVQFRGDHLSSGVYLYRLVVGNKTLIKKMTLIK